MEIRITFQTVAFVLLFGEIINHKQLSKIGFHKEFLDVRGNVYFAKSIFNFGKNKRYTNN